MSQRNTLVRSLHDLGLATWSRGSLMGVVGQTGATAQAKKRSERLRLSSKGWARWAPVQVAALGAHATGGVGRIACNKSRLATQGEGRVNTIAKLAVTVIAAAASLCSGVLGTRIAAHADEGAPGVAKRDESNSEALRTAQRQQGTLQWVAPAFSGVLIVLAAQQGGQQRPLESCFAEPAQSRTDPVQPSRRRTDV